MRIGLQISSLKPYIQTRAGVADTLRRVRSMGYTDVQLQWTGADVPCEFIAEELERNGLSCWGTQDYYDVVMARLEYEIRAAGLYGSRYICVSGVPERFMSPEGLVAMAGELNRTQARLADSGIALTFHPRHMELTPMDGASAAERLLELALGVQLTPHILRHTYCTRLFECGFDVKEIQYLMGHSTPEMTLKVYTHYSKKQRFTDTASRLRSSL